MRYDGGINATVPHFDGFSPAEREASSLRRTFAGVHSFSSAPDFNVRAGGAAPGVVSRPADRAGQRALDVALREPSVEPGNLRELRIGLLACHGAARAVLSVY